MKMKICPKCGKAFEPQANRQKYCSPLCARNAETERNMPYIKMRSKIKSKINTELLEAFDRKCAICGWGLSTDISVKKYSHSGGCQFHHIIPIAQGGTNDEENLILLCPNCHALAHAGIVDCSSEEHPDNFTSFEWLIGRLMFRGCDLWGMTDGEDDNGVVTKLIKDRAAEMMELLERELDPMAEPVDFEKLALEKYPIQMVAKDPFDDEDDTKEDLNEYEREAYLEGLKKGYELEKGGSK